MVLSLAENRMHTCPGYDEESRKCGVMREEKKKKKEEQQKKSIQTLYPKTPAIKSI